MSADLKLSNDLFLGKEELNHLKKSLREDGYEDYLRHMIQSYGVAQLPSDAALESFKVIEGTNPGDISIQAGFAFDNTMNIIENPSLAQNIHSIATDSVTRFVILTNNTSVLEEGTLSIGVDGTLTGTGTLFTEVLRGGPEFPAKISFPDSVSNTGEYLVASVTDDTNAQLNVAAGSMTAEAGITYRIVGTFTPGANPTTAQKYPFEKNFFTTTIEDTDTSDGLTTFVLASVSYDGADLTITDLRSLNKFSTGSEIQSVAAANPLVGLEKVTYAGENDPKAYNSAYVGWGFKSLTTEWSIDTSLNQITITDGSGGAWDDKSFFTPGDFDGWYVFSKEDGQTLKISTSLNDGADILLNIEHTDDIPGTSDLVIIPPVPFISFLITNSTFPAGIRTVTFPTHQGEGIIPALAGESDQAVTHTLYWRHINGILSTGWNLINDGEYLQEDKFNANGTQISPTQTPYTTGNFTPILSSLNHGEDKASRSQNNTFAETNTFGGISQINGPIQRLGQPVAQGGTAIAFDATNINSVIITTSTNGGFAGIAGGVDGKELRIYNSLDSTTDFRLYQESGGSAAENRLDVKRETANKVLSVPVGHWVTLVYDGTAERWIYSSSSFENNIWLTTAVEPTFTEGGGPAISFDSGSSVTWIKTVNNALHIHFNWIFDVPGAQTISAISFDFSTLLPGTASGALSSQFFLGTVAAAAGGSHTANVLRSNRWVVGLNSIDTTATDFDTGVWQKENDVIRVEGQCIIALDF